MTGATRVPTASFARPYRRCHRTAIARWKEARGLQPRAAAGKDWLSRPGS